MKARVSMSRTGGISRSTHISMTASVSICVSITMSTTISITMSITISITMSTRASVDTRVSVNICQIIAASRGISRSIGRRKSYQRKARLGCRADVSASREITAAATDAAAGKCGPELVVHLFQRVLLRLRNVEQLLRFEQCYVGISIGASVGDTSNAT